MGIENVNQEYVTDYYKNYYRNAKSKNNTANTGMAEIMDSKKAEYSKTSSSVSYSRTRQVTETAGTSKAGAVSTKDMTMDEYKQYINDKISSMPQSATSRMSSISITISDAGFEAMKNDPDYEAWVLGYTSVDRSFHNPWASMPGYSPSYHTERFGDSIDEHLGQSSPMKSADSDDGESWWDKRIKRAKEIAEENTKKANKDAAAKEEADERICRQDGIIASFLAEGAMERKNV